LDFIKCPEDKKEEIKMSITNGYGVTKILNNGARVRLYDYIETIEEADLLAQYAMQNKNTDEIIYIFAGWNRGLTAEQTAEAERLIKEKEYEVEDKIAIITPYSKLAEENERLKCQLLKMVNYAKTISI